MSQRHQGDPGRAYFAHQQPLAPGVDREAADGPGLVEHEGLLVLLVRSHRPPADFAVEGGRGEPGAVGSEDQARDAGRMTLEHPGVGPAQGPENRTGGACSQGEPGLM